MPRNIRLSVFIFLLALFVTPASCSATKRASFSYGVPQLSNFIFLPSGSWQVQNTHVKAHCQLECQQNALCVAFTYVEGSPQGQCIVYKVVPQLSDLSKVFTSGATTFILMRTNALSRVVDLTAGDYVCHLLLLLFTDTVLCLPLSPTPIKSNIAMAHTADCVALGIVSLFLPAWW